MFIHFHLSLYYADKLRSSFFRLDLQIKFMKSAKCMINAKVVPEHGYNQIFK